MSVAARQAWQHALATVNELGLSMAHCPVLPRLHGDELLSACSYGPYGYQSARPTTVLGFNAAWFDPVSQTYQLGNGHRSYHPQLRRFISADVLSPFGLGGVNAYAYCSNDPINRYDPSGAHWLKRKLTPSSTVVATDGRAPKSTITISRRGYDANLTIKDIWNGVRNSKFNWTEGKVEVPLNKVFANQSDPGSRIVIDQNGFSVHQSKRDVLGVISAEPNRFATLTFSIDHWTVLKHLSVGVPGTTVKIPYEQMLSSTKMSIIRQEKALQPVEYVTGHLLMT